MKRSRSLGEAPTAAVTLGTGKRRGQKVKSTEGFQVSFRPPSSEERDTRCKQERKISLQVVWAGRVTGKESKFIATQWGVVMAMVGLWRGLGERSLLLIKESGGCELAPLCVPRLGWHNAQKGDLSFQGNGLPAAPTLKTRGPFQKSKDSSQLGPWAVSKANRKRPS